MTTTAFDDQFTVAPEPVRQPYDTVAILRRNVAELELALKRQMERAEAAEADIERYVGINAELATEMTKAREQTPVAYEDYWKSDGTGIVRRQQTNGRPLFAAPVPAPHKGATHCDGCGLTWLDDGLNPLGCPYRKDTVPAPAVPSVVFMAHNKNISVLFAARKDADQYAAAAGPTAGVAITECAVIGSQSAEVTK